MLRAFVSMFKALRHCPPKEQTKQQQKPQQLSSYVMKVLHTNTAANMTCAPLRHRHAAIL